MAMSPYLRGLRDRLGTMRILMPSVAGIVRDSSDRILLVRQSDDDSRSTPGGSIDPDETPATAVVREVWEETGLFVTVRRLIGVYGGPLFVVRYPNGDETQYVSAIFECEIASGQLRPDEDEVSEARFWSEQEAMGLRLSPWLPPVLPRLFDRSAAAWFEATDWRPPDGSVSPR